MVTYLLTQTRLFWEHPVSCPTQALLLARWIDSDLLIFIFSLDAAVLVSSSKLYSTAEAIGEMLLAAGSLIDHRWYSC